MNFDRIKLLDKSKKVWYYMNRCSSVHIIAEHHKNDIIELRDRYV